MPSHSRQEDIFAVICIASVSIFGLVTNGLSFYITRTSQRFRNAFGVLCSGYLLCNLQAVIVLFTWTTVVLSTGLPNLASPSHFFARIPALLACGAWHASALLHFFVALNRFCVFTFPLRYNMLWTEKNALAIAILSWSVMTLVNTIYLVDGCTPIFNQPSSYVFTFPLTRCGIIASRFDAAITITLVVSTACTDFVALIKLIIYRRTCICAFLYITADLVGKASGYFTNKWATFGASTITWIMTHSLDGFVLLIYSQRVLCVKIGPNQ